MAPHTGVDYRVKERETKERETWEHLSLSLSRQEKKKKNIGFPTKGLASDREIPTRVGNILGGQKILVGY
jgi:hypothetical protein